MEEKKKKKLLKAVEEGKIVDETTFAVFEQIDEIQTEMDGLKQEVKDAVKQVKDSEVNLDKVLESVRGVPGHTPTEEELLSLIIPLIPEPIKGDTYVLNDSDRLDIARKIPVPKPQIIEKIIEKTEVIREQPIVTEIIKEVAVKDSAEEIISKINELPVDDEFKIDYSHIKNVPPPTQGGRNVGGHGALYTLSDVNLSGIATNQSIKWNGTAWVPFTPSSGGSGYTKETPVGAVDGSNVTFTVTTAPVYIVSDGATYFDGAGYTSAGLTLTLTVPPVGFIRSFF